MKKSIKAIIVDDEQSGRQTLSALLSQHCPKVKLVGKAEDVEQAIATVESKKPDLVFLDIQLGNKTGFDFLEEVSSHPFHLVFVTAYDQYALKAIKFHALDYLVKPIDTAELKHAVSTAQKSIHQEKDYKQLQNLLNNLKKKSVRDRKLAIINGQEEYFVSLSDIQYLEADGHYTLFHLTGFRKVVSSTNLGEFEKILPNNVEETRTDVLFHRIHHKYLINMEHISTLEKTEGTVIMKEGEHLPIAVRRKTKFLGVLDRWRYYNKG